MDELTEALWGCLVCTDWDVFKEAYPDLDDYAGVRRCAWDKASYAVWQR